MLLNKLLNKLIQYFSAYKFQYFHLIEFIIWWKWTKKKSIKKMVNNFWYFTHRCIGEKYVNLTWLDSCSRFLSLGPPPPLPPLHFSTRLLRWSSYSTGHTGTPPHRDLLSITFRHFVSNILFYFFRLSDRRTISSPKF